MNQYTINCILDYNSPSKKRQCTKHSGELNTKLIGYSAESIIVSKEVTRGLSLNTNI